MRDLRWIKESRGGMSQAVTRMSIAAENDPPPRAELAWIGLLLGWAGVMLLAVLAWRAGVDRPLLNEAYRVDPAAYATKVAAMTERYPAGIDAATGMPVARPPAGADVYLLAREGRWWPLVELDAGSSYRLHLSAADVPSRFAVAGSGISVEVHPGFELVLALRLPLSAEAGGGAVRAIAREPPFMGVP
jgi:cytochrome c oxidase subunit 2